MILVKILLGLAVLSIMVLIHELGHFLAAKSCKIRVLAFSLGFGKVLLHKTIGETDYRLSAIPFGGYVKMAGENPEEGRTDDPDEFQKKPIWQRAFVAIAGPAANMISAVFMLWFMFMWGVERPSYYDRPIIGGIEEESAAKDAGLMPGDSIIKINGTAVHSWEGIENAFMTPQLQFAFTIIRNGAEQTIIMRTDRTKKGLYKNPPYGIIDPLPAIIGQISDKSAASKAGLMSGDTILSIDNQTVLFWPQISSAVQKAEKNTPLAFLIGRSDGQHKLSITPQYNEQAKRYLVGITYSGPKEVHTVRYSPGVAWQRGLKKTWDYTTMIFVVFDKLFRGEVSWREMSGPVGIIPASGFMALQGFSRILNFMALISVNLAVINLFPLIITDGGMLLFLLIEAVRRKPLTLKTQMAINQFGVIFFIMLFALITLNDIFRLPEYFKLFLK